MAIANLKMSLLQNGNWFMYNKILARAIGTCPAVLFGALLEYSDKTDGKEFYASREKLMFNTGLPRREYDKCMKVLKETEIIVVKKKGLPARNYLVVNEEVLFDLMQKQLNNESDVSTSGNSDVPESGYNGVPTYIKNNNKNTLYPTIEDALAALDNGSVDAVITDEFNFSPLENAEKYQVLNGELDKISYAFMFKKGDWVVENWNEAIYELKSPDYNDKDEFTPMVEKYFGYNASSFDYVPSKTK